MSLATTVDLQALAELPAIVRQLQADLAELRERLVVAEQRPMTVAQAADALGCSQKTIRRRVKAGELRHRWTGRRVTIYLPAGS